MEAVSLCRLFSLKVFIFNKEKTQIWFHHIQKISKETWFQNLSCQEHYRWWTCHFFDQLNIVFKPNQPQAEFSDASLNFA